MLDRCIVQQQVRRAKTKPTRKAVLRSLITNHSRELVDFDLDPCLDKSSIRLPLSVSEGEHLQAGFPGDLTTDLVQAWLNRVAN